MTELNVDNQNVGAEDGQSSVSLQTGGSISNANELVKLLESKISEQLKPLAAEVRGVQGRQDKDRTAFREFMDEFKKFKGKGLSDNEAEAAATNSLQEKADAQSDKELLRKIAEKVLGSPADGNRANPSANVIEVLRSFPELDANDPDVVTKVLSLTDEKEAELAALRMLRSRSQSAPSPSAAGMAVNTPPPPADLMSQYQKQSQGLRGNELIELKMQYRRKGLDIN